MIEDYGPLSRGDTPLGIVKHDFEFPIARLCWGLNRKTKTMSAEIDLPNAERILRPGMYAQVTLQLHKAKPGEDIVHHEERTIYYVLLADGNRVLKKKITIGHDDGVEIEVLEGVGPADNVIIRGKNLVSDGEKVRVAHQK